MDSFLALQGIYEKHTAESRLQYGKAASTLPGRYAVLSSFRAGERL